MGHSFWQDSGNLKHALSALEMHDFGLMRVMQVGDMGPGVR